MSKEFNKRCAEALGWEHLETEERYLPTEKHASILGLWFPYNMGEDVGVEKVFLDDMHFHDSYDWAMLLVRNLLPNDQEADRCVIYDIVNWFDVHFLLATPQQISQAALEVLEEKGQS